MSKERKISVIVRSKDEERWIGHCLQSVLDHISVPEIIVVDNCSSDDTLSIVNTFQHDPMLNNHERYASTKVLTIEDYSPGRALNMGAKEASGDYILIISSHCVLRKIDLDMITQHLEDNIAVFGNQTPFYNGKRIGKRYIWSHFGEERVENMYSQMEERYFFHNAVSFFKKEDLINYPFDENLTGKEDRYWAQDVVEKGNTFIYEPDLRVDHHYTDNGNTWKGIG